MREPRRPPPARPWRPAMGLSLAEDVLDADDDQDAEEQHEARRVDGGLEPGVHAAARDRLDAEEQGASAVQRRQGQEVEEAEVDRKLDDDEQEVDRAAV